MSVSHGHSTIGRIEYDGGVMWRRQKRRKSHINEANQWAMEMPTVGVKTEGNMP